MNRRGWLRASTACCAGALCHSVGANPLADFAAPTRFPRPELASEEGGMWALMDREERNLRKSPLLIRDAALKDYVQGIACRLGGEHCPDIRVYLMRTPHFNASMAPNGMLQIWSGLLLRMENEAQLAAVLGHEIAHFLMRHSLQRLRDIKDKAAAGQVLGLFGLVGALGQLAVYASAFAYQRDHENEADRIGSILMHKAGYDVGEAARIWESMRDEVRARDGAEPSASSPLFATHPALPERHAALNALATALPGGSHEAANYGKTTRPFVEEWCEDEIKRGQSAESLALFSRLMDKTAAGELMRCYRGEVYRLRNGEGDHDKALADYRAAVAQGAAPAKAHRGIGLIARLRADKAEARAAFGRYLELAPEAADAPLIQSYLGELA